MRKFTLFLAAALLLAAPLWAQVPPPAPATPATTLPMPVLLCPNGNCAGNATSTVTVTDTFQSLWAFAAGRRDCFIQNKGSSPLWVYIGPIAGATKAKAFVLGAAGPLTSGGGWFACRGTDVTLVDQISITGTAGDAFTAIQY